jgi:hypothetical protein
MPVYCIGSFCLLLNFFVLEIVGGRCRRNGTKSSLGEHLNTPIGIPSKDCAFARQHCHREQADFRVSTSHLSKKEMDGITMFRPEIRCEMNWMLQTALAEAAGGAAAGVVADSVLYAVDSAKVRQQSTPMQGTAGNYRILFRGMVPTIALGSVPVFGTFFLLYAPLRETLHHSEYQSLLPLASAACAVPATLVGIPSDVIKKRLVLGVDPNVYAAINHITADRGWRGLFAGFQVNLIRDIPFAAVKVGLYETFAGYYKEWNGQTRKDLIKPQGAAICGVASGIACAVLTCPLDCINTRIKDGSTTSTSILEVGKQIVKQHGISALFRGVIMRSIVLGIGSSIFWPIQRSTAHWLQPDYQDDPDFHDRLEDF